MSFSKPPSFFLVQLSPRSSHLFKCYCMTLQSLRFPLSPPLSLPQNMTFSWSTDVFICFFISFSPSTEWYLVRAVLLCCIQSNEPHAVHRLWSTGPGESIRYLAHHAQYDCGGYLLRGFYWPCNSSYPILGLLQTPVSGEGEELHYIFSILCWQHLSICCWPLHNKAHLKDRWKVLLFPLLLRPTLTAVQNTC